MIASLSRTAAAYSGAICSTSSTCSTSTRPPQGGAVHASAKSLAGPPESRHGVRSPVPARAGDLGLRQETPRAKARRPLVSRLLTRVRRAPAGGTLCPVAHAQRGTARAAKGMGATSMARTPRYEAPGATRRRDLPRSEPAVTLGTRRAGGTRDPLRGASVPGGQGRVSRVSEKQSA